MAESKKSKLLELYCENKDARRQAEAIINEKKATAAIDMQLAKFEGNLLHADTKIQESFRQQPINCDTLDIYFQERERLTLQLKLWREIKKEWL